MNLLEKNFRLSGVIILVGLLLLGVLAPNPIFASDPATPQSVESLEPQVFLRAVNSEQAFLSTELKAGESTEFTVAIGSSGGPSFEAITYAADAVSNRNGGMGLKDGNAEKTGATLWLDYPTREFLAESGQIEEVTFSVSVPPDTKPGEYVTGIAMQTVNPINERDPDTVFHFEQYLRTVIGIRVFVPGEMAPAIELGSPEFVIEGLVTAIRVPVSNTGNLQIRPQMEMTVSLPDGTVVLHGEIQVGRIYGGHQTELFIPIGSELSPGNYLVSLELLADDGLSVADLDSSPVVLTDVADSVSPITINLADISAGPTPENIMFAEVSATINNTGEPVSNTQMTLIVNKDGEEVERFPMSQSLSVPPGDTHVSTRYIPLTGWTSGEWEFELLLETVEGSGAAVVVDRMPIETKVTVP